MIIDLLPKTRELLARSAFPQELADFAAWLDGQRYTPVIVHSHVFRLDRTLARLRRARLDSTYTVDTVRAAFGTERRPPGRLEAFQATRRAYERFLREFGRLVDPHARDPFGALRREYGRYLIDVRGLSASSRQHHAHTVADFLARSMGRCQTLSALTQSDIERFIVLRSQEISRHSLQHTVAHLRAFLRYCHDRGLIRSRFEPLDTPRTYRGELPPKALPWAVVQALLASIDRRSKAGWRDYCILHLIAHYGLRPSEVVGLRLDSIDWSARTLQVWQPKTRSDLLLPLAPPTLRILRRYLAQDLLRRGTAHPALFLRARCPSGALERTAIGDIFEKRAREAKLGVKGKHVYCLRHTFAMRLLTRGVGVKAIGDVLGHRSLEGTCAYLRLDHAMLRQVALAVPHPAIRLGDRHA